MRRSVPLACTLLRMNMPRIWRPASSSESACAMDTPGQQIARALELDHSRAAATRRFSFTPTYPPQFALQCVLPCDRLCGSRARYDKKESAGRNDEAMEGVDRGICGIDLRDASGLSGRVPRQ